MTMLIQEHREEITLKKLFMLIPVMLVTVMLFCTTTAYGTMYNQYKTGKVNCETLNVRVSPSTSANRAGSLAKGSYITLRGETKKNGTRWYIITYSNKRAYISAQYVNKASLPYKTITPVKYGKTTSSLNVRKKPSTSSETMTTFEKGHMMKLKGHITKNGRKWYVMTYEGRTGYVASEYIKKITYSEYKTKDKDKTPATTSKKYGITTTGVNFRKSASEKGTIISSLAKGSGVIIKDTVTKNGRKWYKVKYNGNTGYVAAAYVKKVSHQQYLDSNHGGSTTTYGLTTTGVNIRKKASTTSAIVASVSKNYPVIITGTVSGKKYKWYKIKYNGSSAYICTDYVKKVSKATYDKYKKPDTGGDSSKGQQVADYALKFLGVPYIWGGDDLSIGVDCSGFTRQVYAHFGYYLPHYDGDQEHYGTAVEYADAKPGDLIFYGGHVGIYIGNGQAVHASSSSGKVIVSQADYRNIKCVRRLFN